MLRNVLVAVVIFIALLTFLWFVPQLQGARFSQNVPPEEVPAMVNEYRRTWAQIIGGFVLLLGLYATWRRVGIAEQTLEVTQDQQVTERFTRAIDQLGATDENGNPRLEVRLGGIYALERIAQDSPERDYSTVMEVLAAYVRENAWKRTDPWPPTGMSVQQALDRLYKVDDSERDAVPLPQRPPTDIQAILDVLVRRKEHLVPKDRRVRLDLHGADLKRANLRGAPLEEAFLHSAHLELADLYQARLVRAILRNAHLGGASLQYARLDKADLLSAHLQEASLHRVCIEGANLRNAHLEGADLSDTIELTQRQIDSAYGDEETSLPEELERPAHWRKPIKEQPNGEE